MPATSVESEGDSTGVDAVVAGETSEGGDGEDENAAVGWFGEDEEEAGAGPDGGDVVLEVDVDFVTSI